MSGRTILEVDEQGERVTGNSFLVLFNANQDTLGFRLPQEIANLGWSLMMDTADGFFRDLAGTYSAGDNYSLRGQSCALFKEDTVIG